MTGMTARWLTLSLAATTLACTVQRCESTIRIRDGSKSVSSSDSDSGLNSVSALLSSSDSDLALPPLPDVLVGAHYFAGWARVCVAANGSQIPGCYSHFHGYTPTGTAVDDFFQYYPTRVPLLGNLTTDVSTVIREVKAADAVLDFFDILYYDGGHDCGMPAGILLFRLCMRLFTFACAEAPATATANVNSQRMQTRSDCRMSLTLVSHSLSPFTSPPWYYLVSISTGCAKYCRPRCGPWVEVVFGFDVGVHAEQLGSVGKHDRTTAVLRDLFE